MVSAASSLWFAQERLAEVRRLAIHEDAAMRLRAACQVLSGEIDARQRRLNWQHRHPQEDHVMVMDSIPPTAKLRDLGHFVVWCIIPKSEHVAQGRERQL